MTFEEAKELTAKYINSAHSVFVTSDGQIYINSEAEEVKAFAEENELDFFQIKPEITE